MARTQDRRDHRPFTTMPLRSIVAAGSAACVVAGAYAGYAIPSGTSSALARPAPAYRLTAAGSVAAPGPIDRGLVDINTVDGSPGRGTAGTGIVVSPGGEVLTNYHVVSGATAMTAIDVANGRMYPAVLVGFSRSADVAVLSLTGASGLPTAVLGDSNGVRPGAAVTAFGNALGMGGPPSEASGTVTALDQAVYANAPAGGTPEYLTGMIGTSAPIQPGDSGGPLVDSAGAVVGMDTAMVTDPAAAPLVTAGYAIPIDTARQVAAQITATARPAATTAARPLPVKPLFGVEVVDPALPGAGTPVTEVEPASPAAAIGLVPGDTITSFDGRRVTSGSGLEQDILSSRPGAVATATWLDPSGQAHRASVRLASRAAG